VTVELVSSLYISPILSQHKTAKKCISEFLLSSKYFNLLRRENMVQNFSKFQKGEETNFLS
jgi:hypothetical protein